MFQKHNLYVNKYQYYVQPKKATLQRNVNKPENKLENIQRKCTNERGKYGLSFPSANMQVRL